ncbi:MAG: DUF4384 domain-containing protein [Candidatus Zixiibacteriota bacterium]|nr:MAG: DUF4384 domain-containing protein [candidate division Zixibacteria bacterium]
MLARMMRIGLMTAATIVAGLMSASAQDEDYVSQDYDFVARIDRYLDAEVWTDHADGEYYEGDNIHINFRVSRDAFVAIYAIDTKGMVKLLFPTTPTEDNYIFGGTTYSLPGPDDDYDLVVTGPEGMEHIQIIASRERFPIPTWYNNSGLVFEGDDRYEYMDYLNSRHFVRYDGQRFAYDRAVMFVREWERYYYRPVYYPTYPSWSVFGNCYIDYPYGGTVYINGIYWGVAPLYIPRILVGWHTITIYDPYDWCWETDFHVSRYNTVVFDHTVIKTRAIVTSKYASVTKTKYLDPFDNGYPSFQSKKVRLKHAGIAPKTGSGTVKTVRGKTAVRANAGNVVVAKKHVRGNTKLVRTERGYETKATVGPGGKVRQSEKSTTLSRTKSRTSSRQGISETGKRTSERASGTTGSGDFYRKKGGSTGKGFSGSTGTKREKSGRVQSGSDSYKRTTKARVKPRSNPPRSTQKGTAPRKVDRKPAVKSSGKTTKSTGTRVKSKPPPKSSGGGKSSGSSRTVSPRPAPSKSGSGGTPKSSGGSKSKKSGGGRSKSKSGGR